MRIYDCSPDKVNLSTLKKVRLAKKESHTKSFLRFLYTQYLKIRYGLICVGEGFRGGKNWDIRRNKLKIGDFAYIGPGVQIIYPAIIGDLALLAKNVQIIGNDHGVDIPGVPINITKPIIDAEDTVTIIEAETWIGQQSIVFAGVKIGRGSIVAAGSVVKSDIPPFTIYGGVPAKLIRNRFKNDEELQKHISEIFS